ncbi:MAG: SBBP repeat-containing protein, partial [Candidatus Binataceae bacterium]
VYSTYLGGSNVDIATGAAVDAAGNAFIAGMTNSIDFPTMPSSSTSLAGGFDAFVAELNPNGNGLIYSSYLGGAKDDIGYGIAVEPHGRAYVVGETFSTDFPTTASAYQPDNPGNGEIGEGFLTRIEPPSTPGGASAVVYSTYFGGPSPNGAASLVGDAIGGPSGNIYVVGGGGGGVLTTTGQPFAGTFDAIVADFDTTQQGSSSLFFSEFIGGSGFDSGSAIATEAGCTVNCPAFVTGYTFSADLNATQLGAQPRPGGLEDGFIAEVDPHGGLNYLTYVGGSGFDEPSGIAVDSSGDAIAAGVTFHPGDFPSQNAVQGATKPAGALFISSDGGASFAAGGLAGTAAGSISGNGLAIDNSVSPAIIYAGSASHGLWISSDGGATFLQYQMAGAPISAVSVEPTISNGPHPVYLASGGKLYLSADGSSNFVQLGSFPYPGPVHVYFVAADEYGIFNSGTNPSFYVFAGTDHGFFQSSDGGMTFAAAAGLTTGNQVTQVFAGVRDTSTGVFYIGTDKGVFVSSDSGVTFSSTNLNFAAVVSMAVDTTTTPPTIYAGTYGDGVIASNDNYNNVLTFGATAPSARLSYVAVDDETSDPATVYVGVGDDIDTGSVWKSTDAGQSYVRLGTSNFHPPCCIFPLAVNNGTLFAANFEEADAFVVKLNSTGSAMLLASNLGGTNHDRASGVAVDGAGNAYIGGLTYSSNFPVANAPQETLGVNGQGMVNGFVAKIGFTSQAIIKVPKGLMFRRQPLRNAGRPETVIITNKSKTVPLALGYIALSGADAGDFQITSGVPIAPAKSSRKAITACGSTLPAAGKCSITMVFTPFGLGTRAATLVVPSNASNGTQAIVLKGVGFEPRHRP